MADERDIPEGRFGRLARLAVVGARTGFSLLSSKVSEQSDGLPAAQHAAEVLGTLRGLAAKVGQMASYVDGVIPEGQRDTYESAMKGLRSATPASPAADVKRLLEEELKAPLDQLFVEWNEVPIASASIGQVHRARLPDGREVAVKVQHPSIVKALESDLANAGILEGFARLAGGARLDSKGLLDAIRTRFREELDYSLEAKRQRFFQQLHADHVGIRIPTVHDSHSSARVLTSDFVRGASFEDACAATPAERQAWAEVLWRFVFRGNLVGGFFNADPHPGNYLFHDGAVTFLDFGCVEPVQPIRQKLGRKAHRAALAKDEETFKQAMSIMLNARPGPMADHALAFGRKCFEPIFSSPYHITREWSGSLVSGIAEVVKLSRQVQAHEVFTMPADMVFMNRLQFGFYSVLARLDVPVDYAEVERSFWHEVEERGSLRPPPMPT